MYNGDVLFELIASTFLQLEDGARPYVEKAVLGGKKLWAEGGSKVGILFFIILHIAVYVMLICLFFRCGRERGGWRENMATP